MTSAESLQTLEFDRVLTLIALEAKSTPGRLAISRRRPLSDAAACESAQAELADMIRFYHREGLLPLAGLTEVAPLFQRDTVLDLEDSWLAVRAVRATQAIRETLVRTEGYPRITAIAERIPDLSALVAQTSRYFTRDGKLREDASAELRAIRARVQTKRAAIQKTLNDVMNRNGDAIQDALIVMRGDRYCVPVRSDHRNAIPGILHERSSSGASFFIEPMGAIELNNDLADLLIQEREEIARIMRVISQLLFDAADDVVAAAEIAGELDAIQACALFSDAVHASRPSFSSDRTLRIEAGRHPLLDERLAESRREAFGDEPSNQKVIPITIGLDDAASALVVSGPNAGGKTVALKTAGLLVAMGMSGLPVPAADGTVLPCVDSLHVLIGDDQSVLEHLSTFSAYLVRLRRMLGGVTAQSLVLLDELGSGTDPEEGAALAAAVIEHLLGTGALLIVTTHLSALKSFAVNDQRIVNASMEFDSATGLPTYRMITGIPGRSRAIEIARMMGLPASIIDSARERLGERYVETDHLLSVVQKRMADVSAELAQAAATRRELDAEKKKTAEARAALEAERAKLGGSYRDELERLRDDVGRQLAAEIKALRDMDRSARASLNANQVLQTITKSVDRAMEFIPAEDREVRVGDRAEHRKFKVTGEVQSIAGSNAILSVSGRRMTVELRDLVPVRAAAPAKSAGKKGSVSGPAKGGSDAVSISAELNLIGQRVDDSLEETDRFLDRSLLEGRQAVRIIHGFGTGTLRKAIREHLRKHPAVRSWRPGDDNEGGDGATVAVLET